MVLEISHQLFFCLSAHFQMSLLPPPPPLPPEVCFLKSEEGQQYCPVFRALRLQHIMNDIASIRLLEADHIIPHGTTSLVTVSLTQSLVHRCLLNVQPFSTQHCILLLVLVKAAFFSLFSLSLHPPPIRLVVPTLQDAVADHVSGGTEIGARVRESSGSLLKNPWHCTNISAKSLL